MLLFITLQELIETPQEEIWKRYSGENPCLEIEPVRTREDDRSFGKQTGEQRLANGYLRELFMPH